MKDAAMANSPSNRWASPGVILVATDLDDLTRLMPFAIRQAKESGARLILLHVLPSISAISTDAAGLPYYERVGALEYADKALLPWCEHARRENIACDALVREGYPAQQITAATRQFQADRVLLGTRSRGKLSKLLVGSVAEQVLRSVYLPVMTVGPEAHLPVDGCTEQTVLHATTLRETSRPSAALACQLAAKQGARLVLLHVLSPSDSGDNLQPTLNLNAMEQAREQAVAEELRQLAQETSCGVCGCVEPVVLQGNPSIEILAKAEELHASLIVLGSTDRSSLGNLTRDRTVYRVLAHARCPVLTLRGAALKPEEIQSEPMEAAHR
jgi:nucleotide-binding universal stress UspA family protein